MLAPLKNCRARYAEMDARIDAAGVRDAGYYRVPGFPYLRTDRTLASFVHEVHTVDEIGGWERRMREFDQEAREFEYLNLGLSQAELAVWRYDLLSCGRGLASYELDDPAVFASLQKVVKPRDDYSSDTARLFKGYPFKFPAIKAHVAKRQAQILEDFARPLAEVDSTAALVHWQVKAVEDRELVADGFVKAIPDELGFPALTDSHWRAFAESNAPQLVVETAGERDRLGTPVWLSNGANVDTSRPRVNYQVTFTRFGHERLAQIVYFIWFKAPQSLSSADSAAQAAADIDGLIWRVTLDSFGRPLIYESLHASGRDHLFFPAQPLVPRDKPGTPQSALIPQADVPATDPVLRIQAASHALRRVVAADQIGSSEIQEYELRPYEDLFVLRTPTGSTRSLYDKNGLIPGTEPAATPSWMKSVGILKPGALRQLGHHPTSYIGRHEFDDAYLLESTFKRAPVTVTAVPPGAPPG